MKEIHLTLSEEDFYMLQRVANNRRKGIKGLILTMFRNLDAKDQIDYMTKGSGKNTRRRK